MQRFSRFSSLAVTVFGVVLAAHPAWARGRRPPHPPVIPKFSGWVVYWDAAGGKETVSLWKALEEISVFACQFDAPGKLMPARDDVFALKDFIKANPSSHHPRVLMTVVNDAETAHGTLLKDPACVHQAIATPEARAAHIQQLLSIAEDVDGIDIDYERVNLGDREAFSQFIKVLGKALHKRKKWLSVVLQPRMATTPDNDSSGAGSVDWAAIVPYVDRIKVMAYLYHYAGSEPGSIAPLPWITQLAEYALGVVPPEKLCVVLHMGGFDWPDLTPGRSIEFEQAQTLANAHHQQIHTDDETHSGYFQYVDEGNKTHTVWIENAAGLEAKVRALGRQGVPFISFWRLGAADPALQDGLTNDKIAP